MMTASDLFFIKERLTEFQNSIGTSLHVLVLISTASAKRGDRREEQRSVWKIGAAPHFQQTVLSYQHLERAVFYLLFVSLVWAFSFGLIKTSLAGVDSNAVAAARLGLALLVFLPFYKPRAVDVRTSAQLAFTGAVQYGGMYIAYLYSFQFLKAHEVALFTVFTPLYVTLIHDWTERRLNHKALAAVALVVFGTWIVKGGSAPEAGMWTGFWIVQVSNLCFAFGQVVYRRILAGRTVNDSEIFALPYLGGFAAAGLAALVLANPAALAFSLPQGITLIYLGVVASGLCFFLWNKGARRVNAGTLAIFNDLKIPLAAAVSLIFFGEQADLLRLAIGGLIAVAALLINEWNFQNKTWQVQVNARLGKLS
jgi:drug/metabolite transporter (DMT)-like permease